MDEEKFLQMLALARAGIAPRERGEFCSVGYVSAVLEGANGKLYRGVNIDLACGLGFCAERSAAAAVLTAGEHSVRLAKLLPAAWREPPAPMEET